MHLFSFVYSPLFFVCTRTRAYERDYEHSSTSSNYARNIPDSVEQLMIYGHVQARAIARNEEKNVD